LERADGESIHSPGTRPARERGLGETIMLTLVLGPAIIVGFVVAFVVAKNSRRAAAAPARIDDSRKSADTVMATY